MRLAARRLTELSLVLAGACVPAAAASDASNAPARCEGPRPTFAVDVQPTLERRCLSCHAGSGEAAEDHDLSRFETVVAQRRQVADVVAARAMPPPGQAPLTNDEANALVRWAACGDGVVGGRGH